MIEIEGDDENYFDLPIKYVPCMTVRDCFDYGILIKQQLYAQMMGWA